MRVTNIPIIDEGHEKLSEVHNHIKTLTKNGACKNDLSNVFFALSNYFEHYLIKEEIYLKSKGYPNFDNHKTSHHDFFKGIERLKDNFERDPDATIKELDEFIGGWLQNHLSSYNRDVVDFLNQKK